MLSPRCSTSLLALGTISFALTSCAPPPDKGTGGTDVEATAFGRGVVTINTDFESTNVSLVGLDGARLSDSFISSASKLSWDISAPTMPSIGEDIVLLDRKFALVTWVNVRTAEIREQFHVDGDELARNPWDYLPIAPNKAYVTRYDRWPGNAPHGDVIVIDPQKESVITKVGKRIDVAKALGLSSGLIVHPARGVVVEDRAYLTTVIADKDYAYAPSRLVVIDTKTDEVTDVKELDGLHDCTGIALAPDKTELAVICSGDLYANEDHVQDRSALVLLSPDDLTEKARFPASALTVGPLGFSVSYSSQRSIVMTAFGPGLAEPDDRAVQVDLDTGETREIYRSAAVAIGGVLCPARVDGNMGADLDPPVCFATDSQGGVIVRFPADHGTLGEPRFFIVDEVVGLPPMYLGQF